MTAFTLLVDKPVHLEMTGKFVAPSAEWIHLSRILQDYEPDSYDRRRALPGG